VILLHCPLQSSGLLELCWKRAWKRKEKARSLCWVRQLDWQPDGVCEQPLAAEPFLAEYRQELGVPKIRLTTFPIIAPW